MSHKISEKEKMVIFAALMHDIGKPVSWLPTQHPLKNKLKDIIKGDVAFEHSHSHWHELYSIAIVKYWIRTEKLKNAPRGIEWMLRHHDGIKYTAPELKVQEIKKISNIVVEADRISSSSERADLGRFDEDYDGRWFVSPFMEIGMSGVKEITRDTVMEWIDKGKVYHPTSVGEFVAGESGRGLDEIVRRIMDDFEFDFNRFDIDYLLSFLMYYTTFLPSASPYKRFVIPDVSLYAHLKLTAAVAHVLSKFGDGFRVYVGDLSGIQSFISSTPSTHAAKILKAKSVYIKIIEDATSRAIASWHGLTSANIIFSSGGKFYVLTDIKDGADDVIREIQKEIFRKTNGKLHITMTYVDYTIDEMRNGGSILEKIEEKLRKEKEKKYWRIKDIVFEEMEDVFDDSQCQICGRHGVDREKGEKFYLCDDCAEIWDLAKSLKFLSEDATSPSKLFVAERGKINFSFSFPSEQLEIGYGLDRYRGFEPFPKRRFSGKFMFLPVVYPMEDGNIKPFENFSTDRKIYVLKGDVDNLGYIFSKGLEFAMAGSRNMKTLSRQLTMSYILDIFFSGRLANLAMKYNEDGYNIYVLFSGGDDFTVVGDRSVIRFLDELKDEFRKSVISEEMSFSASVTRHRVKKRFKDVYYDAEDSLHMAKNHKMLTIPIGGHRRKGVIHMVWFDRMGGAVVPLSYAVETSPVDDIVGAFDSKTKKIKIKHFLDRLVQNLHESSNNWDFYRLHYYLVRNLGSSTEEFYKVREFLMNAATVYKIGLDRFKDDKRSNDDLRRGLSELNMFRSKLKISAEEGE